MNCQHFEDLVERSKASENLDEIAEEALAMPQEDSFLLLKAVFRANVAAKEGGGLRADKKLYCGKMKDWIRRHDEDSRREVESRRDK